MTTPSLLEEVIAQLIATPVHHTLLLVGSGLCSAAAVQCYRWHKLRAVAEWIDAQHVQTIKAVVAAATARGRGGRGTWLADGCL